MLENIASGNTVFYVSAVILQVYSEAETVCVNMYRCWFHVELVCFVLFLFLRGLLPVVIVKQLGPTTITTKYGKLRGSLVEFPKDSYIPLSPVEAYLGLQYGSLHNGNLRFIRASSPNEKWMKTHPATAFRPVCPQQHVRAKHLLKYLPVGSVEWMLRATSFTKDQKEECLSLNLYVPTRGRSQ